MDKRRQALEEKQDELHVEFLMDEYAAELGEQIRREAEEAYAGGEIAYPAELDDSIRAMIEKAPEPGKERKPGKSALRYALVAALTAVLLLGTMIAVQAAGVNVFGTIASWTDSVFRFENDATPSAEEETEASLNLIQAALREKGMPVELAPTWLPEGYEISEVEVKELDKATVVNAVAACEGKEQITITIVKEETTEFADAAQWEKTNTPTHTYTANKRTFYLMENEPGWCGAWTDGEYVVSFFGFDSEEQLKNMINSMGETNES